MKTKFLILCISLMSIISLYAAAPQKNSDEPLKVYDVVEVMPSYPGGTVALMQFLAQNIKYPKDAIAKGIQGRVIIQFTVDKEGNVINPKVSRSVYPSLDKEALRVVRKMGKWTPGELNGKKVNVKYNIPVSFRLN